jgi:hypothetical protein
LGLVAGAISAFTAAYKKFRPQLTAEQDKAKTASDVTKAIVYAIEEFKKNNGEGWTDLKMELKAELLEKVGPEALAIIEAVLQAYSKEGHIRG